MKIRIASLTQGENHWPNAVAATEMGLDPAIFRSGIAVDLTVDKRVGKITVVVSTSSNGILVCDRCGEEFERLITGKYPVLFVQRSHPLPDELPGDDVRSFLVGQEELDVSTEVRDAILLSLPTKSLCREDCRGLCPNCGANLNLEPCRCRKGDQKP